MQTFLFCICSGGKVLASKTQDSTWSINVNHYNWVDSCIQRHFYMRYLWLVAYVWWLTLLLLGSLVGNSCNHMELFAKTSRFLPDQEQYHFPSLLDFFKSTMTIGLINQKIIIDAYVCVFETTFVRVLNVSGRKFISIYNLSLYRQY